jgi:hypothetical protein
MTCTFFWVSYNNLIWEYDLLIMSDEKVCDRLMKELDKLHKELIDLIVSNAAGVFGHTIEQVKAEDEASVIHNGIHSLEVKLDTRLGVIKAHRRYLRDSTLSTQFVERKPGLIVITAQKDLIKATVVQINTLKDQIMAIVNAGRDKHQRHEFIHHVFPRIMTDQLRRHIHIIHEDVKNAWFNWTSRPVPEKFSIEEAIFLLEGQTDNVRDLLDIHEWKALIKSNVEELRSGLYDHVQRSKNVKLLPIMSGKRIVNEKENRFTKNANIPFLLFGQEDDQLPKISALPTFEKKDDSLPIKINIRARKKIMINSHLKLVGVLK